MLESLFPRSYAVYSSLPILGSSLEGFARWLRDRGYPRDAIQRRLRTTTVLVRRLRRDGVSSPKDLTTSVLGSYAPAPRRSNAPPLGALVRSLTRYLDDQGALAPSVPSAAERVVTRYSDYLARVRGLRAATIVVHAATASEFLRVLEFDAHPERLRGLRCADLDTFISNVGGRMGRGRLSHVTSALRAFLRFLAVSGAAPAGLDAQVASPRIYRGERLPRALSSDAVRTFLGGIDRATRKGLRDFALFTLMATYGLRCGEVCNLDLDDISWRTRELRLPGSKGGAARTVPLFDDVATALLAYLRGGRAPATTRRLFLRVAAPVGPIGSAAVWNAFATWTRRAGVSLPPRGGPHCLRHSFAMRMLRQGTSLKTIGDLLGHRSAESTAVYIRLDVDGLREVALPLPALGRAVPS